MTDALNLRTLILNANYLPISVWPLSLISGQDAVKAVIRGRATVVEEWDAVFRSPSREIRVPKVLALNEFAPISAEPKFCRRSILLRDRYNCQYCGNRFAANDLTFDHVIPRSAGGLTTWTNILSACVTCNTRKRNSMPNYSGRKGGNGSLRPLKPPRRPTTVELLKSGLEFLDAETRESFQNWLYWSVELEA